MSLPQEPAGEWDASVVRLARASNDDSRLPASFGDRYRTIRKLGEGGMGIVVLAFDECLGREVALKSLRPTFAKNVDLRARFAREARGLATVQHPNVVQIFDVVEDVAAPPFYVMEVLHGSSLFTLQRRQTLPWPMIRDVLQQSATALAAVHHAGLVHRDVKPANFVFVTDDTATRWLKLIDFGIVLPLRAPRLTRPGEIMGSMPYVAPEQITGGDVGMRADVYSWGVMAFELLCIGRPSSRLENGGTWNVDDRSLLDSACERTGVARSLEHLLARCLAIDPAERWNDMAEVVAHLQRACVEQDELTAQKGSGPTTEHVVRTRLWSAASPVTVPAPGDQLRVVDTVVPPRVDAAGTGARPTSHKPIIAALAIASVALAVATATATALVVLLPAAPRLATGWGAPQLPAIEVVESAVVPTPVVVEIPVPTPAPPPPEVVPVTDDDAASTIPAPRKRQRRSPSSDPAIEPAPKASGKSDAEPTSPLSHSGGSGDLKNPFARKNE